MKSTWTSWLLAGALVASLQWNLRGSSAAPAVTGEHGPAPVHPAATDATSSEGAGACRLRPEALGLSEDARRRLGEACRPACADAEELEARARERMLELRRLLAQPGLDEVRARELAAEVSRLRGQALDACVDSVLELRRVLAPEQVEQVLTGCCPTPGSGGDGLHGRPAADAMRESGD